MWMNLKTIMLKEGSKTQGHILYEALEQVQLIYSEKIAIVGFCWEWRLTEKERLWASWGGGNILSILIVKWAYTWPQLYGCIHLSKFIKLKTRGFTVYKLYLNKRGAKKIKQVTKDFIKIWIQVLQSLILYSFPLNYLLRDGSYWKRSLRK